MEQAHDEAAHDGAVVTAASTQATVASTAMRESAGGNNGHDRRSSTVALALQGLSNNNGAPVDDRAFQECIDMCEFLVQCAASLLLDQVRALVYNMNALLTGAQCTHPHTVTSCF